MHEWFGVGGAGGFPSVAFGAVAKRLMYVSGTLSGSKTKIPIVRVVDPDPSCMHVLCQEMIIRVKFSKVSEYRLDWASRLCLPRR